MTVYSTYICFFYCLVMELLLAYPKPCDLCASLRQCSNADLLISWSGWCISLTALRTLDFLYRRKWVVVPSSISSVFNFIYLNGYSILYNSTTCVKPVIFVSSLCQPIVSALWYPKHCNFYFNIPQCLNTDLLGWCIRPRLYGQHGAKRIWDTLLQPLIMHLRDNTQSESVVHMPQAISFATVANSMGLV